MPQYKIPIFDAALLGQFFFTVDLDGVDFQISFAWNAREEFWYMSIADMNGTPIRSGLKCVVNFPVLRLCKFAERPKGEVMIQNTNRDRSDPGLDDLGTVADLLYADAVEMGRE